MNDQMIVRRQKMDELRKEGIDPFGHRFQRTYLATQLHDEFDKTDKDDLMNLNKKVTVAGRMMAKRGKGKVGFADLKDRTGKIQIYVRKDIVGDDIYHIFKRSDIGDHLGISGQIIKTDMGELTVRAESVTFLSKALRPLPDKWHGLQDKEQKYRQRYLDLISNQDSFDRFHKRSHIITAIRNYLDSHDYLEVETPVLHNQAGGPTLVHLLPITML